MELNEILEKLVQGVKYGKGNEVEISQAHSAILKFIESKLSSEPLFWANMGKGVRNYNEGKRDYRKEMLKKLEGE